MTEEDESYSYFRMFVDIISSATVQDLDQLTQFEEDERLENIDFRQLIIDVHPNTTHTITSFDSGWRVEHQMVFTELGLCDVINAPIAALLRGP